MDFPSKFLWVLHPWDGSEFHPPIWHIYLAGLPIQPGFNILERRLQWVISPTFGILAGHGPPEGMCSLLPLGRWWDHITTFWEYPRRTSYSSSIWPFLRVQLYLQFPKGYPPLLSRPTWGPWSSVQRLTPQMATTVTMGVGTLDISQPLT